MVLEIKLGQLYKFSFCVWIVAYNFHQFRILKVNTSNILLMLPIATYQLNHWEILKSSCNWTSQHLIFCCLELNTQICKMDRQILDRIKTIFSRQRNH